MEMKYNIKAMIEIDKIHDKVFKKTFSDPNNVKTFLKIALPKPLKKIIDFSKIDIDLTNYVSDKFKESFSDIVAKTKMKTEDGKDVDADIYILFEHKCFRDEAIFIQLLKYMYFMWQKDIDENRPLRIIIPLVFYHGEEKWTIPQSFSDQFNVDEEVKKILLNYRYVLFDTEHWDFEKETNEELKDNVFLLTSLVLMKSAFKKDLETIKKIFKFWHEKGFTKDKDKMLFFLLYISATKDMSQDTIKKIFEESKIEGGDLMPTLAQRWIEQGKQAGIQEGIQVGEKKGISKVVLNMYRKKVNIEEISDYTGLSKEEIEKIISAH